ncbi:MAG TPA: STAS domain-containing protein [Solirubrobacteraceae bacterium]|nr:STAS domain-containing protein [Solirubrobacteraceae bacterium]
MSDLPTPPTQTADPALLTLEFEGAGHGPLRAIVAGEIDFASAPSMQARITAACDRARTRQLILDLAGVGFMDSSGLRVLLHLRRELAGEHGGLVLLGPTEEVRHILTLTGLDQHLPVADTLVRAQELLRETENDSTEP